MGVGAFVASADVEGAFLMVSNMMMLKKLCFRKVSILNPSALLCANPVTSRVESICLVPRCRLLFCALMVLGNRAWKALTCGTKCWTMHSENRWETEEMGFMFARDYCKAQKRRRGSSGDAVKDEGRCSIMYAERMICTT